MLLPPILENWGSVPYSLLSSPYTSTLFSCTVLGNEIDINHHHFGQKWSFQLERVLNPEGELVELISLRERSP